MIYIVKNQKELEIDFSRVNNLTFRIIKASLAMSMMELLLSVRKKHIFGIL